MNRNAVYSDKVYHLFEGKYCSIFAIPR